MNNNFENMFFINLIIKKLNIKESEIQIFAKQEIEKIEHSGIIENKEYFNFLIAIAYQNNIPKHYIDMINNF